MFFQPYPRTKFKAQQILFFVKLCFEKNFGVLIFFFTQNSQSFKIHK